MLNPSKMFGHLSEIRDRDTGQMPMPWNRRELRCAVVVWFRGDPTGIDPDFRWRFVDMENGGWLASCGITSHHLTVFCWFLLPRPPFWVGFILADLGRPALSAWFQSVKSPIFVGFAADIGDVGDGSKPMIHLFWERGVEDTQLSMIYMYPLISFWFIMVYHYIYIYIFK